MIALRVIFITIVLTLLYLFSSVLLTNILCNYNANGSLIKLNNKIIGSKLIGQSFKSNKYFHNRPSLNDYRNDISGCSNYPYSSEELINAIKKHYKDFLSFTENEKPDLAQIAESASGLDPDITYEGALSQVKRLSKETGLSTSAIKDIINKKSKSIVFGIVGQKILNVLELNLELENKYRVN